MLTQTTTRGPCADLWGLFCVIAVIWPFLHQLAIDRHNYHYGAQVGASSHWIMASKCFFGRLFVLTFLETIVGKGPRRLYQVSQSEGARRFAHGLPKEQSRLASLRILCPSQGLTMVDPHRVSALVCICLSVRICLSV